MLKWLTFAVPYLLKGPTKGPVRVLIGRSAIYMLMLFGGLFMLAALFVWVMKSYSLELAFFTIGGILLLSALVIKLLIQLKKPPVLEDPLPEKLKDDILANYIPESLVRDPIIQRILKEISENPVPATAAAATLGMILSREYFDGDD